MRAWIETGQFTNEKRNRPPWGAWIETSRESAGLIVIASHASVIETELKTLENWVIVVAPHAGAG
jgi:hypothetical protein